jgi:transcriptional regulator with XRE-family HTH domain
VTEEDRLPRPVDIHVGARIRFRRKLLGLSQQKLAEDLGLTFQQIQKYERGSNRVSASKLYALSRSLQIPVVYFFEGLPNHADADQAKLDVARAVTAFLATPEGLELAANFSRIKQSRARRRIIDLIRAMTQDDDAG